MSWGLFVHNLKVLPASYSPPSDGSEINPEEVLVGDEALTSTIWDGIIGSDGNGRLMALLSEGGTFYYSDDYGATWSEKGTSPWSGTTDRLICDPSSGAWFFINYGTSNSDVWRSTDDGQNWSTVSDPVGQYSDSFIAIDQDGAILMVAARPAVVHRYGDAGGSLSPSSNSSSFASGHNVDGIAIASDNAIFVKHWDGGAMEYTELGYDLSSPTTYNNGIDQPTRWDAAPFVAGPDNVLSWRGQSGSEVTFYFIEPSSTTPIPQWTYDFGFDVDGVRVRHNGVYWLMVGFSNADRNKAYVASSETGADGTWTGVVTINLSAERKADNYAGPMDLEYAGNGWWVIAYYDGSSFLHVERFKYDAYAGGVFDPGDTRLLKAINRQSPDIFLKLDDTGSPESVEDLGRKGYTNATSGAITFEETGLVDDGGTAALFGGGSITVDVTSGAYEHAHVFILSHDGTASERTLLSFNGFTLKLAADDTVVFSDGDKTLASAAVAANTATLVALHFEKIACGTKANLYVGATHAGQTLSELEPASSGDLVLGGAGVTIDYYAMIPSANADVAALQRAFGLSPSLPNAPTSALCGDVKLLVRADDAPVLQQVKPPSLGYWIDAYTIKNIATGEREVYWWKDGGGSVHQAAGGKFDGGLYVPDISPGSASRYPQSEPAWLGYADLDLGTRDFSLSAWVKPGANGFFHLGISARYKIQSGYSIPYGGFAFTVFITPAGPGSWVTVGQPLGAYGPGSPRSQRFALQEDFSPFPSYTPNAWNFVTLCRKAGRFYVTVNGRMAGNRSIRYGRQGAPIVSPGAGAELCMGWNEATNSAVSGQSSRFSRLAYRGTFDDLVMILDEALYTQEFIPPTTRFELS